MKIPLQRPGAGPVPIAGPLLPSPSNQEATSWTVPTAAGCGHQLEKIRTD